ncbi:hypothetical protein EDD15DRAFT_2198322 [Pisolithus albus]|nr:hypothetical protein EDD15DRAFT_2198322 [Pisolithus albus]
MPDIMVRLFLFFFGYATCSLLHITLPQVSWLSTGATTPEIFMDTNSALHVSTYVCPSFDVSANYFKFDVSTTVEPPSSDYMNLAGVTLHATSRSKFDMSTVSQPRPNPSPILRTPGPKSDVPTTVEPPSSDYVGLAGVTLHATSRRYFESDVSTTVEPPSSDYVGLTGIPLDATSW